MPEEVELANCKCLESRLDKLALVMMSLTKRLAGEGTRQNMEHKEDSLYNAPAIT